MTLRETFFTYIALGAATYTVSFFLYQTRQAYRLLAPMIAADRKDDDQ